MQRLLDRSGLEYVQVAHDAGLSVDSLYAWRSGRRSPLPDNLRQLADGLEQRARILEQLAQEIRDSVNRRDP